MTVRVLLPLILSMSGVGFLPARATETTPASSEHPSFVNEGVIAAPLSEVWRVWSTPEGWKTRGIPVQGSLEEFLDGHHARRRR